MQKRSRLPRVSSRSQGRGSFRGGRGSSQESAGRISMAPVRIAPYIILSFTPGLGTWVKEELLARFQEISSKDIKPVFGREDELMLLAPRVSIKRLLELRTVSQVFVAQSFSVNRPSGLLSPENLRDIVKTLSQCLDNNPQAKSFRFDAAGKNSPTMQRLAEKLYISTGLSQDAEEGDILLRIRPTPKPPRPEQHVRLGGIRTDNRRLNVRNRSRNSEAPSDSPTQSWEVLTRVTLLPLSSRDWRVANYRGALDATVAAAICRSLNLGPKENFLNLMCGSGTLLIERALMGAANQLIGVEISEEGLNCATDNVAAAHLTKRIKLYQEDVLKVRLDEGSFNSIVIDLPWGEAIGKKAGLPSLYAKTLERADALATKGAKLAILSQRDDLVLSLMADKLKGWKPIKQQQIFQGGFTPTLFILEKSSR